MRLIDADTLNKRLSEMEAEISEEDCMPGDAFSDGIISAILDIKKCIQNQEIVYDVDKVVKKLEENASRYTKKYLTPYGNNGYRDTKAISIHKAIEIVKQGGVGEDVNK